jgi:DNA-binding transcriptional LysR family regulator
MAQRIDWDSQLGRRLRLRDLHVLMTVARLGSMAKAAAALGVSQPAVSEVIADLENALGVRLLDRSPQGAQPTPYGAALLKRAVAAFDELRQGIRDIEYLTDAGSGEIRIGCPESVAAAFLQPIIARFEENHPRVVLDVDTVNTLNFSPRLRDRTLDLALARAGWPLDEPHLVEDLNVEVVYDDALVVAVGRNHPLARKRSIDLRQLAEEPWVLTGKESWNYQVIAEAFEVQSLPPPKIQMKTLSVHLRAEMAATGRFVTTFPQSVLLLHADRLQLKVLPVDLQSRSWPILAITLKNRTLSPVVERFLDCARSVGKQLAGQTKFSG